MFKNKSVNILFVLALVLVLVLSVAGAALAATPVPAPPTLKLTVTQSPLAIYPPYMIYTAQLSYVPPNPSAQLKVDFYNVAQLAQVYLGSALVDSTGKAVLSKQMKAGTYTAISKIVINTQTIWSNTVLYKVP
jgi:hypothetical protein